MEHRFVGLRLDDADDGGDDDDANDDENDDDVVVGDENGNILTYRIARDLKFGTQLPWTET